MLDDFSPQLPVYESSFRATVVYLALCAALRLVPKRQIGSIAPQDLVAAVVIGGLAVGGIAASHAGPTDCFVMILVVLGWNYAIDRLANRFAWFRRAVRESPTQLVQDGEILHDHLRREALTEEELKVQLRRQGVGRVDEVAEAWLEADGEVSVIKREGGGAEPGGKSGPHPAQR